MTLLLASLLSTPVELMPNAGHQARRTAGARHERTLFAVAWMAWLGAGVRATRGLPTTASGAWTRFLCLYPFHNPHHSGAGVPRLEVLPASPFEQPGIFRGGPLPPGQHDEHVNIKKLRKVRDVRVRNHMFDNEHSPILGRCPVYIRENLHALFII
jgi:hypothetical protein